MEKLSRSRLELFLECPRCFWLLMKRGISRPPPAPYTINSAIDAMLKRQFDLHRHAGTPHPLMQQYRIDAVPFADARIEDWRNNFKGVQCRHPASGFLVYGAVDDIWVDPLGQLMVVDYKATGANEHKVYDQYKRQMEVYQWLLQRNGLKVSTTGYFLFAKVNKEAGFETGKLSFDLLLEAVQGDSSWVEATLLDARKTLEGCMPEAAAACEYCAYVQRAAAPQQTPHADQASLRK